MDIMQTITLTYFSACFYFFLIPFQITIHYYYQRFISLCWKLNSALEKVDNV